MLKSYKNERSFFYLSSFLIAFTLLSGSLLSSSRASAGDSIIDDVSIRVQLSCTMSGSGMNSHTATINPGTYQTDIGKTTLQVFCNDSGGFAIYAIGYTGNAYTGADHTKLIGDITNEKIATGTATGSNSNDPSNWAMKLVKVTNTSGQDPVTYNPENLTIENGYGNYSVVPDTYTKVASYSSTTDFTLGSKLETTYAAFIAGSQVTDVYNGKVKYTVVHPISSYAASYTINYNANTTDDVENLPVTYYGDSTSGMAKLSSTKPEREGYGFYGWCTTVPSGSSCSGNTYRAGKEIPLTEGSANGINLYAIWETVAVLDTGQNVNAKMKSLAANTSVAYSAETSDIKAIRMSDTLPSGFTPSDGNTISISETPIYIYYDNTNNAGIIYVYTTAENVQMNATSSYLFNRNTALTDISGVSDWDAQNATNMSYLFRGDTSITNLSALTNWDISSATSIGGLFYDATSLTSVSALANWDTSSVKIFSMMFQNATSLSDISALANWDTSSLSQVALMFQNATSLSDISALANWDTSRVKSFNSMFRGDTSLSNVDALAKWDTSGVTTGFVSMFYGATSLSDISGLANWNIGNAKSIQNMFWNTRNLIDLSPLSGWDTSSIENMSGFMGLIDMRKTGNAVIDLRPLANWNTSSVTNMEIMFQNVNIASFRPLARWDVSSVENFEYMFNEGRTGNYAVTTLDGLQNWNVSSAKNMTYMFAHISTLNDVSAIENWNITGVTATAGDGTANNLFYRMLLHSQAYPDFTKRSGTWDSDGTFIPSA